MKTLVFSDTHLGKYNRKTDAKLQSLIRRFDRILILGDFYDKWFIEFDDFIDSEYNELFKLLKSKNTIYVWGNHDEVVDIDIKKAAVFSDEQYQYYDTRIGKSFFHFEHGDMFFPKKRWYFLSVLPRVLRNPLVKLLHFIIYKLFPSSTRQNMIGIKMNKHIKKVKDKRKFYIVGHTHVPEIDLENKFLNTGALIDNYISYIVIDSEGNPELKIERA